MEIQGAVLGSEKLQAEFRGAPGIFRKQMKMGMLVAVNKVNNYIKYQELTGQLLNNRTGLLRENNQIEVDETGADEVTGYVFNKTRYARIHEYGGIIYPKIAKVLRFRLADGSWRSAHSVIMPATGFMQLGFEHEKANVFGILQESAKRASVEMKAMGI